MKKQYVAPMADKVDFDYEENVVASGSCTIPPYTPSTPCTQYPPCGGNSLMGLISWAFKSAMEFFFGRH